MAEAPRAAPGYVRIPGMSTKYQILEPGSGPTVVKGSKVSVHAYGVVENETRRPFWNTRAAGGKPFEYVAGMGQVIRGWDMGVLGMQVGEVRRILIPEHEGYGKAGYAPWRIKPRSILSFRVELLNIEGAAGGGDDTATPEPTGQKRPLEDAEESLFKRTAMGKVAAMLNAAAALSDSAQCGGNDDEMEEPPAPAAPKESAAPADDDAEA
eukprot:TRINITY_DN32566_c0_g1_i1.p1 TRINITY_DN32566_c0_g1~~TRINITY_DN32566_c0_g1_i1.p1  ORF type:complete len:210 (+),score=55.60 TRINITY_DN32566_c0_g1_i1:72-701(+)